MIITAFGGDGGEFGSNLANKFGGNNMHIYDSFIQSKYEKDSLCEDGIFYNDNFIAVIDGVSSKGNITWEGHTNGYHAKEIVMKGLIELKGNETAFETYNYLNMLLNKEYGENIDYFVDNPEERLQVTLVIYSVKHRQIWCFGDYARKTN